MHDVSDVWKRLVLSGGMKEVKLDIAGVEYTKPNLISHRITGGVFDSPGIGNCSSREGDFEVRPIGEIPKQAKIKVYVRVYKDNEYSEWIQKGEFFISTRNLDRTSGILSIVSYDAMLKAEEVWLDSSYDSNNWPATQEWVVNDIAKRIGVEVDERTSLNEMFPVQYPVDENGDLTMREVLSYVAVSNAGNWIISDTGKLLLLKYGGIPSETWYLVDEKGEAITIGEVRIIV